MSERGVEFTTERFEVFHHHIERNPAIGSGRDVYQAWFHSVDVCYPICFVSLMGNWVEWMEVTEDHRRMGVATEVLSGLMRHVGELNYTPATQAGDAFCDHFEKIEEEIRKEFVEQTRMRLKVVGEQ